MTTADEEMARDDTNVDLLRSFIFIAAVERECRMAVQ
jgi:hypothetical protein